MEPRKIAISARIDHELIDYLRMNKITVNTAINAALCLLVFICQRDSEAFQDAVKKELTYYRLLMYCQKYNRHVIHTIR